MLRMSHLSSASGGGLSGFSHGSKRGGVRSFGYSRGVRRAGIASARQECAIVSRWFPTPANAPPLRRRSGSPA